MIISWLLYSSWVVLTGDGKATCEGASCQEHRLCLHQTPNKRKEKFTHIHTQAHLQETSHMPTHSPTGQLPLRESQTHQNQWSHSCSQPKAKMEMDQVGGSNHLTAGGPRVKLRWSLGSRPEQWATDLRTYTELEHELGLDHRSPAGRCHWPGWRKEVELLQSLPCLLWCISEEDVERDETWAGKTWAREIASVPVRHSRTELWSHLSYNHDSYF